MAFVVAAVGVVVLVVPGCAVLFDPVVFRVLVLLFYTWVLGCRGLGV